MKKTYPSYLNLHKTGELHERSRRLLKLLEACAICPRKCGVNRIKGAQGFCRTGLEPKIFSYMAHHGEEPPISAKRGSGTIFFSNCNMACAYCQNFEFSQLGKGKPSEVQELASFMLELQVSGCHNINLVTPTHVIPQIISALDQAAAKGLNIPIVYNTGGYELPEIIRFLDGVVDIYLADCRYGDAQMGLKYSAATDYPRYNQAAVLEMHRQTGIAEIDGRGVLKKGLVIRHLVLPGNISGTENVMKFIAGELSKEVYVSLMSQYSPYYKANSFKEICRRITLDEYKQAQEAMHKYGLHNGWTQEDYGLESLAGVYIKPK